MSRIVIAAITVLMISTQTIPVERAPESAGSWAVIVPHGPPIEEQSCWRPGMTRNIGVAELSCDALGR
jgi:hypothetical protein